MPEQLKVPRSASPVARAGAGDISERELSRERHQLQTTPPARVQPVHPKKQLFLTPVNKFTAKWSTPSPNLARIRSCLDEYRTKTAPAKPAKIGAKAASMEDLTPTKRIKIERKDRDLPMVPSAALSGDAQQAAAARIGRFMLLVAWRRRRHDVRCLRKTLESQVSCSERLRMQVSALKSLLDSDNAKVRLAMRELERLKQLLRDKDLEKAVLEREKLALEDDVCAAEDRASEMSIGWRNSRNEAENARAAAAAAHHALLAERAQRERACARLSVLEEDLAQHEQLLSSAEDEVAELRRDADERQHALEHAADALRLERQARSQCSLECAALGARVTAAAQESASLKHELSELRAQLARLEAELRRTREQLDWWPRPLTRMLGAARSLFRQPMSVPEALLWTMMPARHGC